MNGPFLFVTDGQGLPDFFGGKADDGSDELHKGEQDFIHRRLGASPQAGIVFFRIKTVFQDIQIYRGQVDGTEIMNRMVHDVEFIVFISLENGPFHLFHTEQCPFIQFFHIFISHTVFCRIEIVEIAQKITEGISDFSVYIAHGFHDFIGQTDVALIVDGGNPKAHDVGAVFIDNILRCHYIAYRLGHFTAFAVHGKSVGEYCFVWRFAVDGHTGKK